MPYKDPIKRREYARVWEAARHIAAKAKAIKMLGGECVRCGIQDIRVLEIDHIVPILRRTTGRNSGTSLARQVANGKIELSIVQLLCANCHTIKTYYE